MSKETLPPVATPTPVRKAILVAIALTLVFIVVYASSLARYLQLQSLAEFKLFLQQWPLLAPFIFIALGSTAIGAGLPRTAVSFVGGAIFGFWAGLCWAEIASLAGSLVMFLAARWTRRNFLEERIANHLAAIDGYLRQHGFMATLILRQIPLPGLVANTVLGLSQVPVRVFLAASALGFLPQNIIFTLYGCGMQQNFAAPVTLASLLLVVFSIGCYLLYQKSSFAKTLLATLVTVKK